MGMLEPDPSLNCAPNDILQTSFYRLLWTNAITESCICCWTCSSSTTQKLKLACWDTLVKVNKSTCDYGLVQRETSRSSFWTSFVCAVQPTVATKLLTFRIFANLYPRISDWFNIFLVFWERVYSGPVQKIHDGAFWQKQITANSLDAALLRTSLHFQNIIRKLCTLDICCVI